MGNPAADVIKRSGLLAGVNVFRASALVAQPIDLPPEIAVAFPRLSVPLGRMLACRGEAAVHVALRIAATACPQGKWTAVVGDQQTDSINPAAAREAGIALERTMWVGVSDLCAATAMCLDACAVVVVHGSVSRREAQRLQARAAHTSTTLIFTAAHATTDIGADVTFTTSDARWSGLLGGYGHLMEREITLDVRARHAPQMSPAAVRLHDVPAHA